MMSRWSSAQSGCRLLRMHLHCRSCVNTEVVPSFNGHGAQRGMSPSRTWPIGSLMEIYRSWKRTWLCAAEASKTCSTWRKCRKWITRPGIFETKPQRNKWVSFSFPSFSLYNGSLFSSFLFVCLCFFHSKTSENLALSQILAFFHLLYPAVKFRKIYSHTCLYSVPQLDWKVPNPENGSRNYKYIYQCSTFPSFISGCKFPGFYALTGLQASVARGQLRTERWEIPFMVCRTCGWRTLHPATCLGQHLFGGLNLTVACYSGSLGSQSRSTGTGWQSSGAQIKAAVCFLMHVFKAFYIYIAIAFGF